MCPCTHTDTYAIQLYKKKYMRKRKVTVVTEVVIFSDFVWYPRFYIYKYIHIFHNLYSLIYFLRKCLNPITSFTLKLSWLLYENYIKNPRIILPNAYIVFIYKNKVDTL